MIGNEKTFCYMILPAHSCDFHAALMKAGTLNR